jgi:outer membrane receptor protein involved in Fe transport
LPPGESNAIRPADRGPQPAAAANALDPLVIEPTAPVNNEHGSTLRQNVYSLDGVKTHDPNTNATAVLSPPEAVQEVEVTTAGISAEFGDASGGLFNFVTKSGGNDLG